VSLERKHDLFNLFTFIQRKLNRPATATSLLNGLHHDLRLADVPLHHLVNTISLSATPWVVSYEHYLPRWNWNSSLGWKYMAGRPCRKIIAISHWAHRFQVKLLARHPGLSEEIRPKMCVNTPGQRVLLGRYEDKMLDPGRITFAFVGRDFFRKGGLETLEVFSRLIAEGLPVHLTVVSPLTYGDYASCSTRADYDRAVKLIAGMGNSVAHIPSLENAEVIQLLARSHVALLPTYDDTYGFSVLEAQAAGCPVITTDGCALPEINNDTIGWLIEVPKDEHQVQLHRTAEERETLSACIRENLFRIVREICADVPAVRVKGERALERIRQEHALEDRAAFLENLYTEALT
jgi:glycosyltransferase involved in cell wall biosynthesis